MADILKEISDDIEKLKTPDEVLEMAISLEEQGRDFYLEKAARIKNVTANDLYRYLAREESEHAEYLRQYQKDKKAPDVAYNIPDFKSSFAAEFTVEHMDEIGVHLAALRFERKSEYFYMELSRRTGDTTLRELFDKLASIERGHYELIDGFLEDATQFRMQT